MVWIVDIGKTRLYEIWLIHILASTSSTKAREKFTRIYLNNFFGEIGHKDHNHPNDKGKDNGGKMHPLTKLVLNSLMESQGGLDKIITDYLKSRAEWLKERSNPSKHCPSGITLSNDFNALCRVYETLCRNIDQAFELSVGEKCEHDWRVYCSGTGAHTNGVWTTYQCEKCHEFKSEEYIPKKLPERIEKQDYRGQHEEIREVINALIDYLAEKQ